MHELIGQKLEKKIKKWLFSNVIEIINLYIYDCVRSMLVLVEVLYLGLVIYLYI